jgi:WD40 repeat protein
VLIQLLFTFSIWTQECIDIKYISTRYLDSPLFISHGNGVRCVGIGASFLCCGDRQGNLRLWGAQTKNEVIKVKAHKEEILAVDVRATLVATSSRDGSVNIYNISDVSLM